MDVLAVRITKELKREMRKRSNINWSEVIREAIERRIGIEERLEAIAKIDGIKTKMKPVDRGQLDKWLREARNR